MQGVCVPTLDTTPSNRPDGTFANFLPPPDMLAPCGVLRRVRQTLSRRSPPVLATTLRAGGAARETWSGTLDSNQRSPPSEGGENNQTSLVPEKRERHAVRDL
jgi:hypothetical protein